jgi:hypothetical protein
MRVADFGVGGPIEPVPSTAPPLARRENALRRYTRPTPTPSRLLGQT